jgi:hypothetical protein
MKAGRELDALVTERVMGFVRQSDGWYLKEPNTWVHPHSHDNPLPNYSTSIADAREMEDELERRGLHMKYAVKLASLDTEASQRITQKELWWFLIHATPEQRSLAALKAVGVEAPA